MAAQFIAMPIGPRRIRPGTRPFCTIGRPASFKQSLDACASSGPRPVAQSNGEEAAALRMTVATLQRLLVLSGSQLLVAELPGMRRHGDLLNRRQLPPVTSQDKPYFARPCCNNTGKLTRSFKHRRNFASTPWPRFLVMLDRDRKSDTNFKP